MLELYQHDLSDIWDQDLDSHGEYGYALDRYWDTEGFYPFVVIVNGKYAGFALVNQAVFRVVWEDNLEPGPVGQYLEVVDFDPPSDCFYTPVDLNDQFVLAQDGLGPSEGNPQFHQQMVYAVAMTTIRNFERALGRWALWSERFDSSVSRGTGAYSDSTDDLRRYVPRLRIYPHALREANASNGI